MTAVIFAASDATVAKVNLSGPQGFEWVQQYTDTAVLQDALRGASS
jgi:hypothetical protein